MCAIMYNYQIILKIVVLVGKRGYWETGNMLQGCGIFFIVGTCGDQKFQLTPIRCISRPGLGVPLG
jgi:hypothetical protein